MIFTSQVPNWEDINITPVFQYLWGLFHDIFEWSLHSYFVFYGHRVAYGEMMIFCMVFGYVLMLSPFGSSMSSIDPDAYEDEAELESVRESGWFDDFSA